MPRARRAITSSQTTPEPYAGCAGILRRLHPVYGVTVLLIYRRAISSLLNLCREMFSNGLRVLSELRRSSRATRDSKSCRPHAAGRVLETAASEFGFHGSARPHGD